MLGKCRQSTRDTLKSDRPEVQIRNQEDLENSVNQYEHYKYSKDNLTGLLLGLNEITYVNMQNHH